MFEQACRQRRQDMNQAQSEPSTPPNKLRYIVHRASRSHRVINGQQYSCIYHLDAPTVPPTIPKDDLPQSIHRASPETDAEDDDIYAGARPLSLQWVTCPGEDDACKDRKST